MSAAFLPVLQENEVVLGELAVLVVVAAALALAVVVLAVSERHRVQTQHGWRTWNPGPLLGSEHSRFDLSPLGWTLL